MTMPTYGQTIKWRKFNGDTQEITVEGCESFERARREAVRFARRNGWTPPGWWQFWRWKDTRLKLDREDRKEIEAAPQTKSEALAYEPEMWRQP